VIDGERRDVFSIHNELRFLAWGGVMLIVSGAGVLVSKHLDAIGPLTLAVVIAAAAAACYAYAWWKRSRAASLVDDYVLLLGALLLSTDVGFIEHQWHLLGPQWPRHFLLLALAHAVAAYLYDSRMLLSLSIAALAAWLGVERDIDVLFNAPSEMAVHALVCAAIVLAWRLVNRHRAFNDVFDHFIAHLVFLSGVLLVIDKEWVGLLVTAIAAAAAVWLGFRRKSEAFVIYAWIYGTAAAVVYVIQNVNDGTQLSLGILVICVVVIVGLVITHARFRREKA
jgi:hypothetical protein